MKLRPLVIDEEIRSRVAKVVDYAWREENHYELYRSNFIPGECKPFVTHLNSYRCVFTISIINGMRFRHLSISVPGRGKVAHPVVVFTIAMLFGFTHHDIDADAFAAGNDFPTTPGDKWMVGQNEAENTIVVAEPISDT